MKIKLLLIIVLLLTGLFLSTETIAQNKKNEVRVSPKAEIMQQIGYTDVKIIFSTDVTIEGKNLKKGAYSFFAIPGKNEWTLIFNKVSDQWGAFEYNESEDALRIKVKPEKGNWQEWLAYTITKTNDSSAVIRLEWEKVKVPIKIIVKL